MNKRNPTYKGDIFGTQLGDSNMECSSSLRGIWSATVCLGRTIRFKKLGVERIRNIGTIWIGNGPKIDKSAV
jgi:hypothetical protein